MFGGPGDLVPYTPCMLRGMLYEMYQKTPEDKPMYTIMAKQIVPAPLGLDEYMKDMPRLSVLLVKTVVGEQKLGRGMPPVSYVVYALEDAKIGDVSIRAFDEALFFKLFNGPTDLKNGRVYDIISPRCETSEFNGLPRVDLGVGWIAPSTKTFADFHASIPFASRSFDLARDCTVNGVYDKDG